MNLETLITLRKLKVLGMVESGYGNRIHFKKVHELFEEIAHQAYEIGAKDMLDMLEHINRG